MTLTRIGIATVAAGAVAVIAGGLADGASTAQLTIRHQTRGCHAWSLNGGPYRAHQALHLTRGGSLMVTNNDAMAQELVKKSGPSVKTVFVQQSHMGNMPVQMRMGKAGKYTMAHMGATIRVTFTQAGTYRFRLVDRGDYFEVKTVGPDNELTLAVFVS